METRTFKRGIHPLYNKEATEAKPIEKAALPQRVVIPLLQHVGAPCSISVKKGETVEEGQKIGEPAAFVSAPVHAPISGKVKDVVAWQHPAGSKVTSVVIEGDGSTKDWQDSGSTEGLDELDSLGPDELRNIIKEAGIVGLGGAMFPTYVKLSPPENKKIDTVILNGCECEPFLTSDHRVMVEMPERVVWGLAAIMKAVGAKDGYIGIEDNKPDAVSAIEGALKESGIDNVKIVLLETKYPQGAEKMLIDAVLGRKVPVGGLPMDVGVVVNNVGTAKAIYDAIKFKKPLIERVVTVSGNGVKEPKNLLVRIGTSFEDVIAQCGGLNCAEGEEVAILNGGPMMGVAQKDLSVPVIKGTSGITVLAGKELKPESYMPCIRCASCVEVCPMGLMPYRIADAGRLNVTSIFKDFGGSACIECGCCAFVCPSKRPLVQWIRVGKIAQRKEEKNQS